MPAIDAFLLLFFFFFLRKKSMVFVAADFCQRFVGTRAIIFWQYDKHGFEKVDKFVEI